MRLYPDLGLGILAMSNGTSRYDFEPLFALLASATWSWAVPLAPISWLVNQANPAPLRRRRHLPGRATPPPKQRRHAGPGSAAVQPMSRRAAPS